MSMANVPAIYASLHHHDSVRGVMGSEDRFRNSMQEQEKHLVTSMRGFDECHNARMIESELASN